MNVLIEPRDALIFRDGKPFGVGAGGARSVDFPPPSVVAGAVRTRIGRHRGYLFERGSAATEAEIASLLRLECSGPFLVYRETGKWQLALDAPQDVVAYSERDNLTLEPLRPAASDEGCDLPKGLVPLQGGRDEKVAPNAPRFWRWEHFRAHLLESKPRSFAAEKLGFARFRRQKRLHVAITEESQTAQDGMLFSTEGLEFCAGVESRLQFGILAKINGEGSFPAVSHLGGERRTAFWSACPKADFEWPTPPPELASARRIRLILATPGCFDGGWRPGWLAKDGFAPGFPGLELKLIAAAVPRAMPVSGWDLKSNRPKPTRMLAPAGSVYFCDVVRGNPAQLWLNSVCDREQDRLDGFGIVTVGVF